MAGSIVTRSGFSDLMQVKGFWQAVVTENMLKMRDEVFSKLYKRVPITTKDAKFTEIVGFGAMAKANEYGDPNYDTPYQGADKTLTPDTYNLFSQISMEAWEDDQYGAFKKYGDMFARSALHTKEILAAAAFNTGFDTVTTADGKYLFATDHTLEGGGTYKNKLSTDSDLTVSSLQQAIIDMMNTTDGRGKLLQIRPKYLVVPTALIFTAEEILKSDGKAYTSDNDINVFKSRRIEIVENPYITDSDSWFLVWDRIDSDLHPLKYVDRQALKTDIDYVFEKMDAPLVRAYMRCNFGAVGWRGVFGTPGAG